MCFDIFVCLTILISLLVCHGGFACVGTCHIWNIYVGGPSNYVVSRTCYYDTCMCEMNTHLVYIFRCYECVNNGKCYGVCVRTLVSLTLIVPPTK